MELISKKELLSLTGISYGQLYRWKREKLIPEEWFIKRSSYTGQETFFPKEQILGRIQAILEAKDAYSLEELAKLFSPEATELSLSSASLSEIEEISPVLLSILQRECPRKECSFRQLIYLIALSQVAKALSLGDDAATALLLQGLPVTESIQVMGSDCITFQVGQNYHQAFLKSAVPLLFDTAIQVVDQRSMGEIASQIKVKYQRLFAALEQ